MVGPCAVVLGGTRFVGRAVVAELVSAGHDVLLVHRGEHEPMGLPHVPHLHADRRDLLSRAEDLRRFQPDGVVDVSAMTRGDAEIALAALPAGPRLVVVSSMDVYRAFSSVWAGVATDAVPLTEASPVRDGPPPDREVPMDGYDYDPAEQDKLGVEATYLARGAAVCRLPMVYGPHDFKHREAFVLRRIAAGRTQVPVGAGGLLWSRGYAPELARGIRLAVERPDAAGEVLNLCEASCASVRLWIEQIAASAERPLELVRVADAVLPADLDKLAIEQVPRDCRRPSTARQSVRSVLGPPPDSGRAPTRRRAPRVRSGARLSGEHHRARRRIPPVPCASASPADRNRAGPAAPRHRLDGER
ncbi:MAG: NAD-dependent epimerase/dehydratase family protein [Solirubrobacteraceae bacterium]